MGVVLSAYFGLVVVVLLGDVVELCAGVFTQGETNEESGVDRDVRMWVYALKLYVSRD